MKTFLFGKVLSNPEMSFRTREKEKMREIVAEEEGEKRKLSEL